MVKPDLIAYEVQLGFHKGSHAAEILNTFAGLTQKVCAEFGIEHTAYHSGTIKKKLTGKGNAGKDVLREVVEKLFPDEEIMCNDQSDALAVLQFAIEDLIL
jgi:Holliday junction resolvasome RuvABC endonuclease subunit